MFLKKEITENKVVFEGMSFEKVSKNEMNVYVAIKDDEKTEDEKDPALPPVRSLYS